MHQLNGQIRNRHIKNLRSRVIHLEAQLADDPDFKKIFQARELAAIRAVLLCSVELPDEVADGVKS